MIERTYHRHPDVRSYGQTIEVAIKTRLPGVTLVAIDRSNRVDTIEFATPPDASVLTELDDIMAATERERTGSSGATVDYELTHDTVSVGGVDVSVNEGFAERVSKLCASDVARGKQVGGLVQADIDVDLPRPAGTTVRVPDSAGQADLNRLDEVMVAFGKVRTS